jgi:hypothetical protein
MSPIQLVPIIRNEVPWNAVKALKTKKAARFGLRAVPIENPKKRRALKKDI